MGTVQTADDWSLFCFFSVGNIILIKVWMGRGVRIGNQEISEQSGTKFILQQYTVLFKYQQSGAQKKRLFQKS